MRCRVGAGLKAGPVRCLHGPCAIPRQFQDALTAALNADQLQSRISDERTQPATVEIDGLIKQVVDVATQLAERRNDEAQAQMSRAGQIGLGAGLVVVLVLIGSAVFSMLNIARPIGRIGAVLLDLANGNKGVEIPYAGRGDEVGDAARAAQTFKDNLAPSRPWRRGSARPRSAPPSRARRT
jgi:methyl-accepting chemotaxis protein